MGCVVCGVHVCDVIRRVTCNRYPDSTLLCEKGCGPSGSGCGWIKVGEGWIYNFTIDFVVEGECKEEASKNSEFRPEKMVLERVGDTVACVCHRLERGVCVCVCV